jgi:Holliday junction DNA helicase RuvA
MIAHLAGELSRVEADYVVVDVNGVGYKVHAPLSVIASLPKPGERVKLNIFTHVKEDSITLYGFIEPDQQSLFELLITVSGIGPKVALNILSVLTVEDTVEAIAKEDFISLNRVPGIGVKTAQRIILELREKIAEMVWVERAKKVGSTVLDDVTEGLVALGYDRQKSRIAAEQAIAAASDKRDTAEVIRLALKHLTK